MRNRSKRARGGVALLLAVAFVLYGLPAGVRAADGDLDLSFGTGGKVITDFGFFAEAYALAVQSDGKIVTAGYAFLPGTQRDFALARYTSDGSLDPSFGTGGKVTTDFPDDVGLLDSDIAEAVAVQSDGKIVAAGHTFVQAGRRRDNDIAVARYDSNGALDPTFGEDGLVTTHFGGEDFAYAVAVQSDGKVVAAGYTSLPGFGSHFTLVRYNSNGSLDDGTISDSTPGDQFGTLGKVTTNFGIHDIAQAVAVQSDGKIVAAGLVLQASLQNDFALARYTSDGSLDPSFGTGGKVTTDFGGGDVAFAVAVQSDGKIVAAGFTSRLQNDFALARYGSDGSLDPSFGTGGKVITDFTVEDIAHAVAVQSDGKIVAAGRAFQVNTGFEFAVARYDSNGALDPTFGEDGLVTTHFGVFSGGADEAHAVAVQSDGKIVAAGVVQSRYFGVVRYEGTPPAQAQLNAVISAINGSDLPAGTKTSLTAKLRAALAALQAGDTAAACGVLQAFLNHVRAQRGKGLPEAQAAELTGSVTRIRVELGCP